MFDVTLFLIFCLLKLIITAPTIAITPSKLPTTTPAITPGLVPRKTLSPACNVFSVLGISGVIDVSCSEEVVVLLGIAEDAAPKFVADNKVEDREVPEEEDSIALAIPNASLGYCHKSPI
jgi:hypothetical protein